MGGVIRGVFGYCFLIFMVRLVGRRPGEQMTPFDFVLIFFMGGVTLSPMVGDDRSIVNALVIITTIAATHYVIATLKHLYPAVGRIVDGTPLVLLEKGEWRTETMNVQRSAIHDRKVQIWVSDALLKDLGNQQMTPQPDASTLDHHGILYTFGAGPVADSVRFSLQPKSPGLYQFSMRVAGEPQLNAKVLVMP